ncbi:MAG: phosphotransferase [Candidatus Dormiibacterota bacterium]
MSKPETEPTYPAAAGARTDWISLPEAVRAAVEDLVGATVLSALSQPSGFSPGVASRLQLSGGRRVFVKAVGSTPNRQTPDLHREEARVLAGMPDDAPIAKLLGVHDDGDWVALVLEDVEGAHPQLPWRTDEISRVLSALIKFQTLVTPCPVPDLPTVVERHQATFDGWRRLRDHPPTELDPWSRRHLDRLAEREAGWQEGLGGDTLLHGDLRADNLLFTAAGSVVFLDWPGASRGVAWFDPLVMAPSVAMQGGPEPEWLIERHPSFRRASPEVVTTLVVAMAGYFVSRSLMPNPPGLPTLRAFQRAQGVPALNWARRRTGWE